MRGDYKSGIILTGNAQDKSKIAGSFRSLAPGELVDEKEKR